MPGEVHEYDAVVNGHRTVLNLTEADAARLHPGATRRDASPARGVEEPPATTEEEPPATKARAARSK